MSLEIFDSELGQEYRKYKVKGKPEGKELKRRMILRAPFLDR